jgi:hypothetical protein
MWNFIMSALIQSAFWDIQIDGGMQYEEIYSTKQIAVVYPHKHYQNIYPHFLAIVLQVITRLLERLKMVAQIELTHRQNPNFDS